MLELIDTITLSRQGVFPARALEFTAIDFETTGLHPGHIIELAAVRVAADGTVLGELSTLVNPGPGIDPGPVGVHRITREQLDGAPALGDVLGQFLELCRNSVVVAHNLPFKQRFLIQELARLGVRMPPLPGICTLSSARQALRLPNYRLATVAGAIGMADFPAHTALGGARVCAQLVSTLVRTHRLALSAAPHFLDLPRLRATGRLVPRPEAIAVGEAGWTGSLAERIPTARIGTHDSAVEEAYLELLGDALADQHMSAGEGQALAALAADTGMSADDVRRIHSGFVTAMRQVAESDGIITPYEERDLRVVADALGVPELVRDLRPAAMAQRAVKARVLVLGATSEADELRAAILAGGIQLAKKLTASVTHLVVDAGTRADEPRLRRADELGVTVLAMEDAPAVLGLASAPPVEWPVEPTVVIPVPAQRPAPPAPPEATAQFAPTLMPGTKRPSVSTWAGRGLMGLGLFLMFVTVAAQFGGASLGAGLFLAVIGVGALLGGWWMTEQARDDVVTSAAA
jgi:DNA polymerase-3 subunit epsilon